jgi:DNA-binding response OmpR family regulator
VKIRGCHLWRAAKPLALVIDDDPDIAPLVKVALAPYAISSENVGDGATALMRLRTHRYDLIILDLAMNGINGFDVLLALKNEVRLRGIPVIVLTASSGAESLARSFGYGADDFVIKPFETTELGMRAYRLVYPPCAR